MLISYQDIPSNFYIASPIMSHYIYLTSFLHLPSTSLLPLNLHSLFPTSTLYIPGI